MTTTTAPNNGITIGSGGNRPAAPTPAPATKYRDRMHQAAAMLPPVPTDLPPRAQQQYAEHLQAAAEVLADTEDATKRAHFAETYNIYLSQYAQFARQSERQMAQMDILHRQRTGGMPMPQNVAITHGKQWNHAFWHQFNTVTLPTLERRSYDAVGLPAPGARYDLNNPTPAREALGKLGDNLRGGSMLDRFTGIFYDSKHAKQKDSTLAGINFGGIGGAIAGWLAGGIFGVDGIIGGLIKGAMALGFAYGGSMLQDWLQGKKQEKVYVATPGFRGAQPPAHGRGLGLNRTPGGPGEEPQVGAPPHPSTITGIGSTRYPSETVRPGENVSRPSTPVATATHPAHAPEAPSF